MTASARSLAGRSSVAGPTSGAERRPALSRAEMPLREAGTRSGPAPLSASIRSPFATRADTGYQAGHSPFQDAAGMAGSTLASGLLRHRAPLLRFLRARGAADDAEDVLQELWFKAAAMDAGRIEDELAYLYRAAHNLLVDRHRAELRRRRREAEYQETAPSEEEPSAERTVHARDQLRRLDATLDALGERSELIFRRHRIEFVPQREIARELGISLSAVEKHLQKAYRALGELQEDAGRAGRPAGKRDDGD